MGSCGAVSVNMHPQIMTSSDCLAIKRGAVIGWWRWLVGGEDGWFEGGEWVDGGEGEGAWSECGLSDLNEATGMDGAHSPRYWHL